MADQDKQQEQTKTDGLNEAFYEQVDYAPSGNRQFSDGDGSDESSDKEDE